MTPPYRWTLQARIVPSRGVPNGATQGALPYQDIPSQYRCGRLCNTLSRMTFIIHFRQTRTNLPRYIKRYAILLVFVQECFIHRDFLNPDKWSPALQIRTVLLSIQALLSSPNPDDPLAADVAKHYKEDEAAARQVSKEWTERYAT